MFFDSYDTPVFRPPSEARSFILRVTRGCAHNKCTYCNMYRGVPFQVLTEDEVARQIEAAAVHGRNSVRRVFLADGDALVLSTPRLLKILDALYKTFPKLQRVAAYSAPKDILRKSHEELVELREAGLKLLYYGMETGDDITLQAVKKGVSGEEAVEAGRKVIAAGMKLSMMIILGLAGKPGSKRHAAETAKAINAIKPTDIRNWQNELIHYRRPNGKCYSPTYLRTINNQLTAAFNFAVKFYGLRENPCHKAGTMGKKNADEMLFWTNEEFKVFIEAMEERPVGYTIFTVMYYTGLRVGELLALTPEDIDFDRHIISVNKNYQRLNGKDYIYPPKTEAGYREVVMPKVLENCLKDYLAKLYEVQPTDRIFPYDRGWVGRQMKYGCDHSGTQKIRVHDVRHPYVKPTTKKFITFFEVFRAAS